MAFPTTVDLAAAVAEAPGKYGPFEFGGDLYVVNILNVGAPDPDAWDPAVFQSIDQGVTWTELDGGNRPTGLSKVYSACQSTLEPNRLFVVFNGGSGIDVYDFDLSMGLWGSLLGSDIQNTPTASCYRESDNSIVMILPGSVTLDGQVHIIPSFEVFDIAGSTFSSPEDLDFEDYDHITVWNQLTIGAVCDSDNVVHVFSAQATRPPDLQRKTVQLTVSDPTYQIPFDCTLAENIRCFGGGGGGGGTTDSLASSGGGGGGYSTGGPIVTVPGSTTILEVGLGGTTETPGGNSSLLGVSATGGGAGSVAGSPGVGGTGNIPGGDGGAFGVQCGGGGGGGATLPATPGTNGADGDGIAPAPGGVTGGGDGGFTTINSPIGGTPANGSANSAGGGGGASGVGLFLIGADGGVGLVQFEYQPDTTINPGRMWQQSINPDNSLGALGEIAEGGFPVNQFPQFDCCAGDGFVLVAMSGVTDSNGNELMLVSKANNAESLTLDFVEVATEGTGPGTPGVAVNEAVLYLAYLKTDSLASVDYMYRVGSGASFGAAVLIGNFTDFGCRVQIAFLATLLTGTFGSSTQATELFVGGEGGGASIQITAVTPGVQGNNILGSFFIGDPGSGIVVELTDFGFNVTVESNFASNWDAVTNEINNVIGDLVIAETVVDTGDAFNQSKYLVGGSTGYGVA